MNAPDSSARRPGSGDEKKRQENGRRQVRFGISYVITSLIALSLFQLLFQDVLARSTELPYSEFKKQLAAGRSACPGPHIFADDEDGLSG